MSVYFKVGPIYYEIGAGSFLYSIFSTVAHNLENRKWGNRFPYLMKNLFNDGKLPNNKIDKLEAEVKKIRKELKEFSPDKIVWDFENLAQRPPWGNEIADTITDLSNYFVTSDGKDFFEVFFKALDDAKEINMDIELDELSFKK